MSSYGTTRKLLGSSKLPKIRCSSFSCTRLFVDYINCIHEINIGGGGTFWWKIWWNGQTTQHLLACIYYEIFKLIKEWIKVRSCEIQQFGLNIIFVIKQIWGGPSGLNFDEKKSQTWKLPSHHVWVLDFPARNGSTFTWVLDFLAGKDFRPSILNEFYIKVRFRFILLASYNCILYALLQFY